MKTSQVDLVVGPILCALLLIAAPSSRAAPAASTLRMAERLKQIADTSDPLQNPFLNHRAAAIFKRQLEQLLQAAGDRTSTGGQLAAARYKYAYELLHAGESEAAVREFEALRQFIRDAKVDLSPDKVALVRMDAALAYLRMGEQDNCLMHHSNESCLMPIAGGGIHQVQRGSRGAIPLLMEQLQADSNDLRAGWLLNLAYMTLGEYPDKVPAHFRIPPSVFDSEYPLPKFPDIAGSLGLAVNDLAGGVVMDDLDGDGNLDLMVSGMGLREQIHYFRNQGDGTFAERTEQAGLIGEWGGLNLFQADYDNDGNIDILVLRGAWFEKQGHHPNSLLRNNGDGTFRDVTEEAGLLSFHPTQAATWLDFNNDGWIDLFIGNETTPGDTNHCELFRNNGDGTFTECAAACGISALGLIKAVHSGDYDNDGLPDLYISCRGQPNVLYHNDGSQSPDKSAKGAWRFTDVTQKAGVAEPVFSFPAWFMDYDNDGWLDIFVCGYGARSVASVAADYLHLRHGAERPRLYRNNRDGTFTDVTEASGLYRLLLAMSGNFGDLDNDGFLDIYLGTGSPELTMLIPNRMMRNDGGRRFQDVTTAGGFGHLQKGHGIAFGDLDNDGDQDIYAAMGGAYEGDVYFNALFENPGTTNRWLKLRLVGTKSNRAAIGARIKVTVAEPSGERAIYKSVNSGGSFGASPLRQEIGLGAATEIRNVEVWWPASGIRQNFPGLKPDRCYVIREGERAPTTLNLKPIRFARTPAHHHP